MVRRFFVVTLLVVLGATTVVFEPVSAQNSNSSTTMSQDTNMGHHRRHRRHRRHARRHARRLGHNHNKNANSKTEKIANSEKRPIPHGDRPFWFYCFVTRPQLMRRYEVRLPRLLISSVLRPLLSCTNLKEPQSKVRTPFAYLPL